MTTSHGWLIRWFMIWSLGIADPDSTIEIAMDQKSIHDSETNIFGDSCFFFR
jgi:hypothetical protein